MNRPVSAHDHARHDRPALAIAARIGSTIAFTAMAICIKEAHQCGAASVEIFFYRQIFSLPIAFAWVFLSGGLAMLRSDRPIVHVTRAVIGTISMIAVFLAIESLPLAEWTVLSFVSPLFATMLSALLLREHVGVHRWSAIVIGFSGVIVMMWSNGIREAPGFGVLIGLAAAFLVAAVMITIRQINTTEPPARIMFWFTVQAGVLGALLMPWNLNAHPPMVWLLLIGVGVCGGVVQVLMGLSLHYAPVGITAPFDYMQLVWATLVGWLLWDQLPDSHGWVGALLIVGSGLYTFHRERRLRRDVAAARATLA